MITSSKKRWPLFRYLGKRLSHDFIVPTKRLLVLLLVGAVWPLLGIFSEMWLYVWYGYLALLLVLSLVDLGLLPKRSQWSVVRSLPERVDVHQSFEIQLELVLTGSDSLQLECSDDLPLTFVSEYEQEQSLNDLGGTYTATATGALKGKKAVLTYKATATERGKYLFHHVVLRYARGMSLWQKQVRLACPGEIGVYPDLSQVRGVLSSMQDALILDGNRVFKKQRSGSEFHYVRDYMQGDDTRQINWKASARTAKLMTNIYQPEKGKIVTLLIDCGRMMGIELKGQMKLDRTLEAALTLAAIALKQGDQVALLAFSSTVKVYVPPGKGLQHLQELTHAVYDLKADFVESSYSIAMSYIIRYQKKRSMLVVFSDMESYLYDKELAPYLQRLRQRHRMLLLSLNDPLLHGWVRIQAEDSRSAYIQSVAHKFTLDRKVYMQKMASRGIPIMDVPADQLTLSSVNAYLELKSRDVL